MRRAGVRTSEKTSGYLLSKWVFRVAPKCHANVNVGPFKWIFLYIGVLFAPFDNGQCGDFRSTIPDEK